MYRKPIVSNALRVARWREVRAGGCVHFAFFLKDPTLFFAALWPRATIPKDNMAEEILATVSTYYVTYVPQEAKTVMSAMSSDDWVALATCVLPLLCLIGHAPPRAPLLLPRLTAATWRRLRRQRGRWWLSTCLLMVFGRGVCCLG